MRTALLAVAALAAGGLVVPTTIAVAAADPQPAPGTHYRDPAVAASATVSVSGVLTPIHSEVGEDRYAVSLADGRLVPVSLDRLDEEHLERPRPFSGDLAVPAPVERQAESRGADIDAGDDIDGRTGEGKVVLAAASTSTQPLPVATATLGTPTDTTARAATATAHRLYVAVITNRGTVESESAMATKTATMRQYWATESDGYITSFTQPAATVSYDSTAAPSVTDGCGLANPTATWNEAAGKFPGVSFSGTGNHLMVLVSDDCGASGAAGIGTVGGSLSSGGRTIVTLGDTAVAIGVHELGHNLSLSHANAEKCPSTCSTAEYWDLYSIMGLAVGGGSWTPTALDTAYRVQTGIADSSEVPTVTQSRTVHLSGRGTSSGTRGLLVTDPASGTKYAVEYRAGNGRDSSAFYAPGRTLNGYVYRPGIVIERIESNRSTTMITRPAGGKYVTSFVAGETFTAGQLSIGVASASAAAGADLTVTLPGSTAPTTTPAPPTTTPPTSTPPTTAPPTTAPPTTAPPTTAPPVTPALTPGTPLVYGTAQVGRQLAVAPGRWSPQPWYWSVRWLADGAPVAGATGARLTLTRALLGARISVRLTGYRSGYATASATSVATVPVQAGRFTSRTVRITGHAVVGRTLVARTASWDPHPTFSYRWYANGRKIKSATHRTLEVTQRLRGKRIAVRITATQAGYRAATRSSGRTSSVR